MLNESERNPTDVAPQGHEPDQGRFHAIRAEDVHWTTFAAYPPTVRLAIMVGDPTKQGPYTIRVKVPGGTKFMAHKHPEDRVYTVISGVFYVGLGEQFDESRLASFAPGTIILLPGNQPHFHWAKSGEYTTQITATGPLGIEYIDADHDPRNLRS